MNDDKTFTLDRSNVEEVSSPDTEATAKSSAYRWIKAKASDHRFLEAVRKIVGEDANIGIFFDSETEFSRIECDGLITVTGRVGEKRIGIVLSDFRVQGGSFSLRNCERLAQFMKEIETSTDALVFLIDSLGIRFVQGRNVFSPTFQNVSALWKYRQNHPVITVSLERALGIGSIFFSQGHYRIALGNESLINLTGPEVMTMFFGTKFKFEDFSSAGHQKKVNTLIHEIAPDREAVFARIKAVLGFPYGTEDWKPTPPEVVASLNSPTLRKSQVESDRILSQVGERHLELFTQLSPIIRVYVSVNRGRLIGVLMNPLLHPNNMMSVSAIDKCKAAMEFFEALKIPVISLLDCPGGDPRPSESDADSTMKMIALVHHMISYPFGKMGIITGRCFGGSGMFVFPKIYGGWKNFMLDTANCGIIADVIVNKVIENSPRMKEEWAKSRQIEKPDYSDMVASGNIDAVITTAEIGLIVDEFLDSF